MEPSWFFGRIRRKLTVSVKKQGAHLDRTLVFKKQERTVPSVAQWRRLPLLLSKKERRILRVLGALLLVSGAVAMFGFTGGRFALSAGDGGRWIEGVVGVPRLANPILATRDVDRDITKLVYSGLMRETADGTYIPDVAERVVVSPDSTRYTVTVRQNVVFHDGEPLTVEDVLFTYRSIQDAAWHSPYWKSLKDAQITAADNNTVVFALGKSFPAFESMLAIGILPKHLWKDVAADQSAYAIWNVKPIGSGPFAFSSLERLRTGEITAMELVRNELLYEARPHLDRVTLRFFGDLPSAVAALSDGRVHGVFVPARHTDTEFPDKRFRSVLFDSPQVVTLYFNAKETTLTPSVRSALEKAINRRALLDALHQGAVEAFSPVPVSLEGPAGPAYEYDPDAAKATILKIKTGLTLTMLAPADPFYHDIVEVLRTSFTNSGVTLQVSELDSREFVQAVRGRSYDMVLWSNVMPYGVDLYPYWHSSQIEDPGLNFAGYRNRKIDTVLEKLRGALDGAERVAAYADITKALRDDSPAVFLVSPRPQYVTIRRLHGEMPNVVGFPSSRFAEIRDWSVRRTIAW